MRPNDNELSVALFLIFIAVLAVAYAAAGGG